MEVVLPWRIAVWVAFAGGDTMQGEGRMQERSLVVLTRTCGGGGLALASMAWWCPPLGMLKVVMVIWCRLWAMRAAFSPSSLT
jgi:hypothetical protein